jgi:hypothetical protein
MMGYNPGDFGQKPPGSTGKNGPNQAQVQSFITNSKNSPTLHASNVLM